MGSFGTKKKKKQKYQIRKTSPGLRFVLQETPRNRNLRNLQQQINETRGLKSSMEPRNRKWSNDIFEEIDPKCKEQGRVRSEEG